MVACLIALPIFLILGIFSASYRSLAKEAFECIFLKVTLRPCKTGLDKKIKASVVSAFSRPKWLAKFVYKQFEMLSLIFGILMVASTILVIIGGINFYLYGNCNGPVEAGFCIFDPSGANSQTSTSVLGECTTGAKDPSALSYEAINVSAFPTITRENATHTVVVIGCYSCQYTRKALPILEKIRAMPSVNYTFVHLPLNELSRNLTRVEQCIIKYVPEEYWGFHTWAFTLDFTQVNQTLFNEYLESKDIPLSCLVDQTIAETTAQNMQMIVNSGAYGTPTVFIDGEPIVGPKPERVYSRLLK